MTRVAVAFLPDTPARVGQASARLAGCLMALALVQPAYAQPDGLERDTTAQGSTVLVPSGRSATKRPALILLPFTGGSARDLYERWYARSLPVQARERGFIVVIPGPVGSAEDYSTGAAWTATLDRYTRNIAADARELAARFDADPDRIGLAGYSMGGDLAWALIQRSPDLYAGAIVMGSRASYRDAAGLKHFGQRGGRVHMFLGESESEARRAGTRAALESLERAGISRQSSTAPGEHVWAPPAQLATAIDFVLGYAQGEASPAAGPKPVAPAVRPASSREIVTRLPGCDWVTFEDEDTGMFGYQDAKGKVVVPARFGYAEEFQDDGLAGVFEGGQWAYLNCKGKTFPVMAFDNGPDRFSNGLARIREAGRTGYVNRRGEVVIAAQFEWANPFCGGVAMAGRDCDTERRGEHDMARCRSEFFIDQTGGAVPKPRELVEPPNCETDPSAPKAAVVGRLDGCGWTPFLDEASGLYGYRDTSGKTVVKPRFTMAREFDGNGVALAREDNWGGGYLTCAGKFTYVFYDQGWDTYQEGLVRIETPPDYNVGFANLKGDTVIPAKYHYATPFCGGIARVGTYCTTLRDPDKKNVLEKVECRNWQFINPRGQPAGGDGARPECVATLTPPGQ